MRGGGGEEDERRMRGGWPLPGAPAGSQAPTVGSSAGAWQVKVRGLHGPDRRQALALGSWNVSSPWGEEPERVREVGLPVRPGGATS